ncbi:MAG: GNVR domain-containing protein [Vulcanimicrobiota bacterium]
MVLAFVRRWWRFTFLASFLCAGLVAAIVLLAPRHYASGFSVFVTGPVSMTMSPEAQQFAAMFGLSTGGSEYVSAILESETLHLTVMEKLSLATDERFLGRQIDAGLNRDEVLEILRDSIEVEGPHPPLLAPVRFTVETDSAELSQAIADEFFQLLEARLQTETQSRSSFLEDETRQSKQELEAAIRELREFAESEEIVVPLETQSQSEFSALTTLNTERILAEAELRAVRSQLASSGNLEVQMALKSREAGLEAKVLELQAESAAQASLLKQTPRQAERYRELTREVNIREHIFQQYVQQLQVAQMIEQGKSVTSPYRIIDEPIVPVEPVRRYGALKTVAGFLFGFMLALAWALFREGLDRARLELDAKEPDL